MCRTFIAIQFPDHVADQLCSLPQDLLMAKWVPEDNLHLTLEFLGELNSREIDDLMLTLGRLMHEPITMRFSGLGVFGDDRPRTLYANPVDAGPLIDLQMRVQAAVKRAGLQCKRRKYKPHTTVAKISRTPSYMTGEYLEREGAFRTEPFQIHEFSLLESQLGNEVPVYSPIAIFPMLRKAA